MIKFQRGRSNGYILITPASPLLDLEEFLGDHLFALGTVSSRPTLIHVNENFDKSCCRCLVTDSSRKFVLAVATRQDLDNFVTRRGRGF